METDNPVLISVDHLGIATITLNRPEKGNAFDDRIISLLLTALSNLANNPEVRCLVLTGSGKHFCSGADLAWMKSMASKSEIENLEDAKRLAHLMRCLDSLPIPTISVVQGAAYGGALGLLCCSDLVIAQTDSQFCLSEVKLGLVPATICPYVVRTLGARHARRFMLTAEVIPAQRALELGLVHELLGTEEIEGYLSKITKRICHNGPVALQTTKALIHHCHQHTIDETLSTLTSEVIAKARVSPEGQEGIRAFFSKTKPDWVTKE